MLLIVTCFLLLEVIASTEGIKPKSVNLALETVLAFDHKDNSANIKFLDDVQHFLTKVRKVVEKPSGSARKSFNAINNKRFTDFVKEIITKLKAYDDDDLEDIFAVIDDESRKYHYKGCKFYELVKDRTLQRLVADKLDLVKEKPAHEIRLKLDEALQIIDIAKFDTKQSELVDYINSLYTKDDIEKLNNIIRNLETYKVKTKRANIDLITMVRSGIRNMFFDHYSGLNGNIRRDLRGKIETFWQKMNQPDRHGYNNLWTVEYTDTDKRLKDIEINKNHYPNTPPGIKEKDLLISKEITPFKREKIKNYKTDLNKKKIEKFNKYQDMSKNLHEHENSDGDSQLEIIIPDKIYKNERVSKQQDLKISEELLISDRADNKERDDNYKNVEEFFLSEDDSSSGDDTDRSVTKPMKPNKEATVKSKRFQKKHRDSKPLFINVHSKEYEEPKKHSKVSEKNGKSEKKHKSHSKKSSALLTLYPEAITSNSHTKKRKQKKKLTTAEIRMHTLWVERAKQKKHHRSKERYEKVIAESLDAEINVGTERDYRSRIRAQPHKIKGKHYGQKESEDLETADNDKKGMKKKKGLLKSGNEASTVEFGIRFILTGQKNAGYQPKLLRTSDKKHSDRGKSTEEEGIGKGRQNVDKSKKEENKRYTTSRTQNLVEKSRTENIVDITIRDESAETSTEEELDNHQNYKKESKEKKRYTSSTIKEIDEKSTEDIEGTSKTDETAETSTEEEYTKLNTQDLSPVKNNRIEDTTTVSDILKSDTTEESSTAEDSTEVEEEEDLHITPNSEIKPDSASLKTANNTSAKIYEKIHEQSAALDSPIKNKKEVVEKSIGEILPTLSGHETVGSSEEFPTPQLRNKMHTTSTEDVAVHNIDDHYMRAEISNQNKLVTNATQSEEGTSIEESKTAKVFYRKSNNEFDSTKREDNVSNRFDLVEQPMKVAKDKDATVQPTSSVQLFLNVDPEYQKYYSAPYFWDSTTVKTTISTSTITPTSEGTTKKYAGNKTDFNPESTTIRSTVSKTETTTKSSPKTTAVTKIDVKVTIAENLPEANTKSHSELPVALKMRNDDTNLIDDNKLDIATDVNMLDRERQELLYEDDKDNTIDPLFEEGIDDLLDKYKASLRPHKNDSESAVDNLTLPKDFDFELPTDVLNNPESQKKDKNISEKAQNDVRRLFGDAKIVGNVPVEGRAPRLEGNALGPKFNDDIFNNIDLDII